MNMVHPVPMHRVTFVILGFAHDGSDGTMIEQALQSVDGVRLAYLNAGLETAFVAYDPSCCDARNLIAAVEQSGRCAEIALPR